MKSRLINKNQAAELLDISLTTLWRWMKDGKISYSKIGARVFFDREKLIEEVLSHTGEVDSVDQAAA